MEFTIIQDPPETRQTDCLVIGLFSSGKLAGIGEIIDNKVGRALSDVFTKKDHRGEIGETALLYRIPGISAERVLIVGLGEEDKWSEAQFRKAVAASVNAVKRMNVVSMVSTLADCAVKNYPVDWHLRHAVELVCSAVC